MINRIGRIVLAPNFIQIFFDQQIYLHKLILAARLGSSFCV